MKTLLWHYYLENVRLCSVGDEIFTRHSHSIQLATEQAKNFQFAVLRAVTIIYLILPASLGCRIFSAFNRVPEATNYVSGQV
jgi:hypothetical protein